jgi:DNA-binding LytR/AlgR family response regulator
VISLQAQDHYVDVKTTLGKELILIRLSDAIKELGEDDGIQVHRSWWVTKKHIVKEKRIDNKPFLVLTDQTVVPVSRTYRAQVTKALSQVAKHS